MIALVAAALLAADPAVAPEQLYAEGRCPELEIALAGASLAPDSAYYLGACRLAAGDARGAEEAFDVARTSDAWAPLALFMRGLAQLKDQRPQEARWSLEQALAEPALPADLAATARELLQTTAVSTVHGAVHLSGEYDTNALQAPVDDVGGLAQTPSAAAFANAVLLWDPAPRWQLRAILLQRQLFQAPDASVGAALLNLSRRFTRGHWTTSLAADGGGYLLAWGPFLANGGGRLGTEWNGNGGGHVALSAGGRWQQFAGTYAGFTGPDASASLEVGHTLGPLTATLALDHGSFWTRDPDFDRDVEAGALDLKADLGDFTLRLRAAAGMHLYRHVNSLRDENGTRTARQDVRLEATAGVGYALDGHWSLALEGSTVSNASSISAYDYRRSLGRAGVTCAF